ncbi:hypothetical protein MKEN_00989600 [Mycena kentingensis (nom. inval.)]|nr:hypothetical protein MKEN_00989600 [Mycena kentingensis (nom. inval.)]
MEQETKKIAASSRAHSINATSRISASCSWFRTHAHWHPATCWQARLRNTCASGVEVALNLCIVGSDEAVKIGPGGISESEEGEAMLPPFYCQSRVNLPFTFAEIRTFESSDSAVEPSHYEQPEDWEWRLERGGIDLLSVDGHDISLLANSSALDCEHHDILEHTDPSTDVTAIAYGIPSHIPPAARLDLINSMAIETLDSIVRVTAAIFLLAAFGAMLSCGIRITLRFCYATIRMWRGIVSYPLTEEELEMVVPDPYTVLPAAAAGEGLSRSEQRQLERRLKLTEVEVLRAKQLQCRCSV